VAVARWVKAFRAIVSPARADDPPRNEFSQQSSRPMLVGRILL
jgi:hypothetical protein